MGTILGTWLASQSFGLMSKFAVLNIWSYFPSLYNAEISEGESTIKHYAYFQIMVAVCFIILAVFDNWYFFFHPFEVAIVVDL